MAFRTGSHKPVPIAACEQIASHIKQIEPIRAPRVSTTVVEVKITDAGVAADKQIASRVRDTEPVKVLPDILAFLQKEAELTRHTLADILKRSGRLGEFKVLLASSLVVEKPR